MRDHRGVSKWAWWGMVMMSVAFVAPVDAQRHDLMRSRVPAEHLDEARALADPLPDSPEVMQAGKALYEGKGGCVRCHGAAGAGDGEASAELNPPPRNFQHHGFWRHRAEGEIFWVVKYGSPGTAMVPFGGQLSDEEIWSIIRYERSFSTEHQGRGPMGGRGHGHGRRGMMHDSN